MRFEHVRRLTGRSLLMPAPGAAVEHVFEAGDDVDAHAARWSEGLGRALERLGLTNAAQFRREFPGGVSLGLAASIDALYATVDLLEWASETMCGTATLDLDGAVARYREQAAAEANPALLSLLAEAHTRGVPAICDDHELTLGLGRYGRSFPVRALPEPASIDWTALAKIPVALVTGTNGKTTTTRMAARILGHAGYVVGATSTDAITIDGQVVEAGDWTGPGAARTVLRRPEVTAAVLETARGGILRRGLVLEEVDAAIVTNVAEDHFGEWGITTLDAMAAAKGVVWGAVRPGGAKIVNADDPVLMRLTRPEPHADWVLVSRESDNIHVVRHRAAGGRAFVVRAGYLVRADGDTDIALVAVADIPATFAGAAQHNVENALAAAAVAHALGASDEAIASGLRSFGRSPADNPGRLQLHDVRGVRVLLDFSHNPHGVRAVRPTLQHLLREVPGSRLSIAFGQAGDRTDHDIELLAREVFDCRPERIWLRPLPGYERGRAPGETAVLLHAALVRLGMSDETITEVASEVDALDKALAWAQPGDLVVHFVHIERQAVSAYLDGLEGRDGKQ